MGTDCSICVAECPFNENLLHSMIKGNSRKGNEIDNIDLENE
jgi:Na+-translocating ferredoxin:NAD+ oxidoreductase RNF subunit RnfB